ncbi:uncharacterized protein LOC143239619 [Tachypleus tridentatus]|uniref:uncharacterized protein LOC143239619 n=1 Tax=Tachypleus tridentatus TaxID=6853 RepID=UPI003FD07A21
MNSAAVIGRQLRQHNTSRVSGPVIPPTPLTKPRATAPSHQTLYPYPAPNYPQGQQGKSSEEEIKPKGFAALRNKLSWSCCWGAIKSFSVGSLLIMVGITMSVVGFYAGPLSTHKVQRHNETVSIINEHRQYHLHNLTYVGPALMGIGGIALVAACVMFEGKDTSVKIVPSDQCPRDSDAMLSEYLLDGQISSKDTLTVATRFGNYLTVPNSSPFFPVRKPSMVSIVSERRPSYVRPTTSEPQSTLHITNGSRPQLPLPMKPWPPPPYINSPQIEDEFVPSPQDIDLLDPDGCETPILCSLDSLDLELHVIDCPMVVRVQVESGHLASVESDGLSDTDSSEVEQPRSHDPVDEEKEDSLLRNKSLSLKTLNDSFSGTKLRLSKPSSKHSLSSRQLSSVDTKDPIQSGNPEPSSASETPFISLKSQLPETTEKCFQHIIQNTSFSNGSKPSTITEDEDDDDERGEQAPLIKECKVKAPSVGKSSNHLYQFSEMPQTEELKTASPTLKTFPCITDYDTLTSASGYLSLSTECNHQQQTDIVNDKTVIPFVKIVESGSENQLRHSFPNGRKCGISS